MKGRQEELRKLSDKMFLNSTTYNKNKKLNNDEKLSRFLMVFTSKTTKLNSSSHKSDIIYSLYTVLKIFTFKLNYILDNMSQYKISTYRFY
jgi:hypothetical protein